MAQRELSSVHMPPVVCAVPVRMQEAWLLIDEIAIRWASGNENGKMRLHLPRIQTLEDLPDPKAVLKELLKEASGLSGRRYKERPAHRVADFIDDFAPLRVLSAFQALEAEIEQVVKENDWQAIS